MIKAKLWCKIKITNNRKQKSLKQSKVSNNQNYLEI